MKNNDENRKGYTFVGWYIDKELTKRINPGGILPGTMELYDKWELDTYTIEYVCDGAMNSRKNPKTVTYESGILPLYPATRKDMVFDSWTLNGKRVNFLPEGIYENIKLVANFKPLTVVSFETNGGGIIKDKVCDHQNRLDSFRPPVKLGCEFVCWCWDPECKYPYSFDQMIQKDTTLYAKWKVIEYNITYDVQGGLPPRKNPRSYTYFDGKIDLLPARKKGYRFVGWKDGHGHGRNVIPRNSIGDKHFIACFEEE